jgi:hypothetical protein
MNIGGWVSPAEDFWRQSFPHCGKNAPVDFAGSGDVAACISQTLAPKLFAGQNLNRGDYSWRRKPTA